MIRGEGSSDSSISRLIFLFLSVYHGFYVELIHNVSDITPLGKHLLARTIINYAAATIANYSVIRPRSPVVMISNVSTLT